MKRYPAFDPPEYVRWKPDREVSRAFRRTLDADPERRRIVASLSRATLLKLYEGLLRARLHDIALKRWVRQGVLSKAWLGTGEEAVAVGNARALREGDLVGPMIRNAGARPERGMSVARVPQGDLGPPDSVTR